MTIKVGDTVRPTTIGKGPNGETYDWTYLRGRVLALWTTPGRSGELVADVKWTRGEYGSSRRTTNFPVACLVRA